MNITFTPMLFVLAQAVAPAPTPTPAFTAGPVVALNTSLGRIKIGLRKDKAPLSVDNFLKYVRGGHYDGTIFHRVKPDFMIQGGGMEPDLSERPTRPPIRNESRNGLRNLRGTLAMARTNDPDSATAQFFINTRDNHFLDFGMQGAGYAVFGEVLEGMDVVDKIASVPTTKKGVQEWFPVTAVLIKTARELSAAKPAAPGGRPSTAKKPAAPKPAPKPAP